MFVITIVLLFNNFNKNLIIFYGNISIDNYSTVLKIIILFCTIIFLIIIFDHIKQYFSEEFEFSSLISFAVFALLILISSNDLITFYLSIEMQSLCLYVLATFKKTSQFSLEAGLKYFVLGAFSSSLLIFGMSLIYGSLGSTNFSDITKILISIHQKQPESISYILKIGLILLLCGFLFKLAAVPFHI